MMIYTSLSFVSRHPLLFSTQADQLVTVLDEKSRHITVTNRFKDDMLLSADSTLMGHLKLQDALIVGNCHEQVSITTELCQMFID